MRHGSAVLQRNVVLMFGLLVAITAAGVPVSPDAIRAPAGVELLSIDRDRDVRIQVRAAGAEALVRVVDADDRAPPIANTKRSIYRGNLRADVICESCSDALVATLAAAAEALATESAPLLARAGAREAAASPWAPVIVAWLVAVLLALAWALAANARTLSVEPGRVRLAVLVAMAVAFCLRAWVAESTALAADETWLGTFRSPGQYAGTAEVMSNPPLYPTLAWPLLADPLAARFLSVLLGTLTVGLVGALASAWFGPQAALVAAGIAALHPFLVAISAANRAYALSVLVLVAALGAVARAKALPTPRARWIAAALLGALPWTHYGTLPALGAMVLWLLLDRRSALAPWLAPLAAGLVLALPAVVLAWLGAWSKATEDFGTGAFPTASSLWAPGAAVLLGLEPPSILDHSTGNAPAFARVLAPLPTLALLGAGLLRAWKQRGNVGVLGAGLVGLVGLGWPLLLAGRLATVRDLHFFVALAPMVIGYAWLAREGWSGRVIALVAAAALAPGLVALLANDDPRGARAAGRMLAADPSLHALVVGHAAALSVRSALGAGPGERVQALSYCGRAAPPPGAALIVVRGYCTLASLGLEGRACTPLPDSPELLRCPAGDAR
jgi:hypothetical protein